MEEINRAKAGAALSRYRQDTNDYQKRKAKHIAKVLLVARDGSGMTPYKLAQCVALMDDSQWRAVCFVADVPVADLECKAEVLRILRERV
jgi:hypothetical protein